MLKIPLFGGLFLPSLFSAFSEVLHEMLLLALLSRQGLCMGLTHFVLLEVIKKKEAKKLVMWWAKMDVRDANKG